MQGTILCTGYNLVSERGRRVSLITGRMRRERERELHEMFDVSLTAHSGRRPAPRSPRPKLSQLVAGSLS